MINILFWSVLAAVLYRVGGTSWGTKYRDWGVPTCMLWYFILMGVEHWSLVLCWGLMFGAQTTYNKWAAKLIGRDTNDVIWICWAVTGLAYSCALLPLLLGGASLNGCIVRGVVVTLFTLAWSELIGEAWIEESGRGFIQIITLPLLMGG